MSYEIYFRFILCCMSIFKTISAYLFSPTHIMSWALLSDHALGIMYPCISFSHIIFPMYLLCLYAYMFLFDLRWIFTFRCIHIDKMILIIFHAILDICIMFPCNHAPTYPHPYIIITQYINPCSYAHICTSIMHLNNNISHLGTYMITHASLSCPMIDIVDIFNNIYGYLM